MHRIEIFGGLAVLVLTSVPVAAQQQHGSSHDRGASVMGFEQSRTTHHFSLYRDGGAIEVTVKDPADTTNRDAIRSHLPHIAMMFGQGSFDAPMLVHESTTVPGTKAMATLKDRMSYTYVQTPDGGRVNIITTDSQAVAAVHEFLMFQIKEHKTGDSIAVQSR